MIDRILQRTPFQFVAQRRRRSRPAILAFHGVDDPANFEVLMDETLHSSTPISIDDLDRAIHDGVELPNRPVLVTFDDGHRSVLDYGLPILRDRGMPAVAFVVAGLLSTSQDYWWSAVEDLALAGGVARGFEGVDAAGLVRRLKQVSNEQRLSALRDLEKTAGRAAAPRNQLAVEDLEVLERNGIAIGNHTWTHPCLNRCSSDTVIDELERSHELLCSLGIAPRWFAYPNGDWDPRAEARLVHLGYRLAFMFDHRLGDTSSSPLRVSRLRVNSHTSIDRFRIVLSGLHPAIHHARRRG